MVSKLAYETLGDASFAHPTLPVSFNTLFGMLETSVQFVCILIINQTCNCVKIIYGVPSLATPTLNTQSQ